MKIGASIERHAVIDSTNIRAKELIRLGAAHGEIVIADRQTGGKGRRGRVWESPSGVGIWMSVILKPNLEMEKLSVITLVAGLSMCETLREYTDLEVYIKWPNDLVINGKKVCGILSELTYDPGGNVGVVVGIGVNVNMESFGEILPYATSLAIEGKRTYDREQIVTLFANKFEQRYTIYEKNKGFKELLNSYKELCLNIGKKAKIIRDNKEYVVTIKDVMEDGSLLVRDDLNDEQVVSTGEVSIRGLYGYI